LLRASQPIRSVVCSFFSLRAGDGRKGSMSVGERIDAFESVAGLGVETNRSDAV
jgi:hypothetical protein